MYLLYFAQNETRTNAGLFNSLEEGRLFASKIPTYKLSTQEFEEDVFEYETIDPDLLSDYTEIEYNGNFIPISRFMFTEEGLVELIWEEIPNLSQPNQGIVDHFTIVDAYAIENHKVKDYIEKREEKISLAIEYLKSKGYQSKREYFGSQDGEAIIYSKDGKDWRFLDHADPMFVYDNENKESFIQYLESLI